LIDVYTVVTVLMISISSECKSFCLFVITALFIYIYMNILVLYTFLCAV